MTEIEILYWIILVLLTYTIFTFGRIYEGLKK